MIKIEGVDDTNAAKYVEICVYFRECDVLTFNLASISERRLLSFTVRPRRSEDRRLESSGAKLPGHMVWK